MLHKVVRLGNNDSLDAVRLSVEDFYYSLEMTNGADLVYFTVSNVKDMKAFLGKLRGALDQFETAVIKQAPKDEVVRKTRAAKWSKLTGSNKE